MSTLNNFKSLGELSKLDYITETHIQGMIGDINNPLLNLPLKNNLDMICGDGSVTFTRSTTGTYIDRYGVVQDAAINTPRFEKEGLLIEGPSTNKCLQSEDFSTTWGKTRSSISTNAINAPNGNATADKLTEDSTAANSHNTYQPITTAVGNLTGSIFLKKGTRTKTRLTIYNATDGHLGETFFDLDAGLVISGSGSIKKLANDWYRCSISAIVTDVSNYFTCYMVNDAGSAYYDGDGSSYLYLWGAQLEELPFSTSYIHTTTAAVTRNIEYGIVSTYVNNIPAIYNANIKPEDLTMICDFDVLGHISDDFQYIINIDGVGFTLMVASMPTSNRVYIYYGNPVSVSGSSVEVNKLYRLGFTYNTQLDQIKTYLDGEFKLSRIGNNINTSGDSGYTIMLGSINWGRTLYGHMKNFKIYDKAFSENEIKLA